MSYLTTFYPNKINFDRLQFDDEEQIWLLWNITSKTNNEIYQHHRVNKYELELDVPNEIDKKLGVTVHGTSLVQSGGIFVWIIQIKSSIAKIINVELKTPISSVLIELNNFDKKTVTCKTKFESKFIKHSGMEFCRYARQSQQRYINLIKCDYDSFNKLLTVFLNGERVIYGECLPFDENQQFYIRPIIRYYDDGISIRTITTYNCVNFAHSLQFLCKNIIFNNELLTDQINKLPKHVVDRLNLGVM